MDTIYFYGYQKNKEYSCFSNFYICNFEDEGINFFCSEQYMMYQKALLMGDDNSAGKILRANSPFECKKLGRKVKPWDNDAWVNNRYNIVYNAVLLKFTQNQKLKEVLLKTDDLILAEASPYDKIWGIGLSKKKAEEGVEWKGLNLLGEVLMEVRDDIKRSLMKNK